jgi:hypothetical protein
MDDNSEQEAFTHLFNWARQSILFAINLDNLNKSEAYDIESHFEEDAKEAEQIALQLFEETEAELRETATGDTFQNYVKKVFSWCFERRNEWSD